MERLACGRERIVSFDIETTTAPLFAVDHHKRIIAWNSAAASLFGLTPARVMGKSCRDALGSNLTRLCASCEPHCAEHAAHSVGSPALSVITSATTGTPCAVTLVTLQANSSSGSGCIVHVMQPVPDYGTAKPATDHAFVSAYQAPDLLAARQMVLGPAHLTARELDILRLLAHGHSSLEIAAVLQISRATARNHIASILAKFGANTRLQAVTMAARAHII